MKETILKIGGMHCASCALNVERALRGLEGVKSAVVNLASEKATAEIDPGIVTFGEGRPSGDAAAGEEFGKVRAVRLRIWTAWGNTGNGLLGSFDGIEVVP
jgi:copper chaperone CopZ